MTHDSAVESERIAKATLERFGVSITAPPNLPGADELRRMVEHSSHRKWGTQPVDPALLKLLYACALSAPSKSDLQQYSILVTRDAVTEQRDPPARLPSARLR